MQGVLFKGSLYLESLGRAKVVTFDKSGTLTMGHAQVVHASAAPSFDTSSSAAAAPAAQGGADKELARTLRMAAALETHSSHPLAPAIVGYAAAHAAGANAAP